jgi:hypothetical protein
MSIGSDERFYELAHKIIVNEARPSEQDELEALFTGNPALKEKLTEIAAEAAMAREVVPLLGEVGEQAEVPPPPMERLRWSIRNIFAGKTPGSAEELRELIGRLETWAEGAPLSDKERVRKLVAGFRTGMQSLPHVRAPFEGLQRGRMLLERFAGAGESQWGGVMSFAERLRRLEVRMYQLQKVANSCATELRDLAAQYKQGGAIE